MNQSETTSYLELLNSLQLTFDNTICNHVKSIASDRSYLIDELAFRILQDPVILIELYKFSSDILLIGEDTAPNNLKGLLHQLGSHHLADFAASLTERNLNLSKNVEATLENIRSSAKRATVIAQILAHSTKAELSDEAQTATALGHIGDMLACTILKEEYLKVADSLTAYDKVHLTLAREHSLDVAIIQNRYLETMQVPAEIVAILTSSETAANAGKAFSRNIVLAAIELVDSFDRNIWQQYKKTTAAPTKSALSTLGLTNQQYERVIDRCENFLKNTKEIFAVDNEEPELANKIKDSTAADATVASNTQYLGSLDPDVQQTLQQALKRIDSAEPISQAPREAILDSRHTGALSEEEAKVYPLTLSGGRRPHHTAQDVFNEDNNELTFPCPSQACEIADFDEIETALGKLEEQSRRIIELITELGHLKNNATSADDLMQAGLELLLSDGPFSRAAIVELAPNRRYATVKQSTGGLPPVGTRVPIFDPLSPLNIGQLCIQSFNSKDARNTKNPFGVSSFAICPLRSADDRILSLYADCGADGAVPLDTRFTFRYYVGYLNQLLKEILA